MKELEIGFAVKDVATDSGFGGKILVTEEAMTMGGILPVRAQVIASLKALLDHVREGNADEDIQVMIDRALRA